MGKTERIAEKEYKQFNWSTQLRTEQKRRYRERKYYRMGCLENTTGWDVIFGVGFIRNCHRIWEKGRVGFLSP